MKVKWINSKKGIARIKVENNEDLWALSRIITPGSLVSSYTTRLVKKEEREGQRKKMYLTLNVEKVEFRESSLKVLGKVVRGPEEVSPGSYHSFNIGEGNEITVEKEWSSYDRKILKKSLRPPIKILAVIIDSREATFALISRGTKELFSVTASLPRKDDPSFSKKVNDYYKEVASLIKEKSGELKTTNIIVAGPGFAAEELIKATGIKAVKAHTSHTGMTGVRELIRNNVVSRIAKDNEISRETALINDFFEHVAKGKLVKYGLNDVKNAVNQGAVKILLISEEIIKLSRERKRFKELESIINMAEKSGAQVEFISSKHDAGKMFHKFGGIGALLRYEV